MAKVKVKCLSRFKEENEKEGREKEDQEFQKKQEPIRSFISGDD